MTDVAIVGGGPYGLSLAAHLRARGVAFRIFGQPMGFWQELGPGRYLKSFGFATQIHVPQPGFSFVEYCRARGLEESEPCSIADFTRYGNWVQEQLVPELEATVVERVCAAEEGFDLTLAGGESLRARRLVVAVGLQPFSWLPPELLELSPQLVTHTAALRDLSCFAGKRVGVVGAGQSALEAAALLHEAGALPELLVRGPRLHFSDRMPHHRSLRERLRAPQSVLGPGLKNWALEKSPSAAHYVPHGWRLRFARQHLGPSGAWWLRERVEGKFPVHLRSRILGARSQADRIQLRLRKEGADDRDLLVDRLVAGVGFQIDLDRLLFLAGDLRGRLRRLQRAPLLDRHFQSSVRGLYFVGPAAAPSFGPLFRFVAGAAYAAPALARHLARRAVQPAGAVRGSSEPELSPRI